MRVASRYNARAIHRRAGTLLHRASRRCRFAGAHRAGALCPRRPDCCGRCKFCSSGLSLPSDISGSHTKSQRTVESRGNCRGLCTKRGLAAVSVIMHARRKRLALRALAAALLFCCSLSLSCAEHTKKTSTRCFAIRLTWESQQCCEHGTYALIDACEIRQVESSALTVCCFLCTASAASSSPRRRHHLSQLLLRYRAQSRPRRSAQRFGLFLLSG